MLPVATTAQPAHFKTCIQKPHNQRQIFNQKRSYLPAKIRFFIIFLFLTTQTLTNSCNPKIHEFSTKCATSPYYGAPELRSCNFDKLISVLIPCKSVSNKIWRKKGLPSVASEKEGSIKNNKLCKTNPISRMLK